MAAKSSVTTMKEAAKVARWSTHSGVGRSGRKKAPILLTNTLATSDIRSRHPAPVTTSAEYNRCLTKAKILRSQEPASESGTPQIRFSDEFSSTTTEEAPTTSV